MNIPAPQNPPDKNDRMNLLEGARFLLAFAVVGWHYYYLGPLTHEVDLPHWGGRIFPLLSFAVEAFFIISGFVIIISAENKKPFDFATQRFLRLAPALLICSTLTLLIYTLTSTAPEIISTKDLTRYISSIFAIPPAFN